MPTTAPKTRKIGELCIGGDWACAHGDLGALRDIAERLAVYTPEPMHCELGELARACRVDPDLAAKLWPRLKQRLWRGRQ